MVWPKPRSSGSRTKREYSLVDSKVWMCGMRCGLFSPERRLDSALFGRSAAVVRDWRGVLDRLDRKTVGAQRSNGRLASCARAGDHHVDGLEPVDAGLLRAVFGGELCRKRSAFSASFEIDVTGAGPTKNVALRIADRHDRVVERRVNVRLAVCDGSLFFGLALGCSFSCHLLGHLLLSGDRLGLAFASSGVAASALSTRRESTAVSKPAVAA